MSSNTVIFKAGTIFDDFKGKINAQKIKLIRKNVEIDFPTRLAPMSIDDTVFIKNKRAVYLAGGIVISISNPVKISVNVLGKKNGILHIDKNVKSPAVINHGYKIMCKVLGVDPSLSIKVDDSKIPMHSGFASNGASFGAICSSINELFGNPIENKDLFRFLVNNYGEQYDVGDLESLGKNICVGGSLSSGLFEGGIQVLSSEYTIIGAAKYNGSAIIGIPIDHKPISLKEFTHFEQKIVRKIINTPNEDYKRYLIENFEKIALPKLAVNDISGISDIVFGDRFNDEGGLSIKKYISKIFPRSAQIAKKIRSLYDSDKPHCDMLGTSSLSSTFFALVSNETDKDICLKMFKEQEMDILVYPVCNNTYSVKYDTQG